MRAYSKESGTYAAIEMFPETTEWKKLFCSFEVKEPCRSIQLVLSRNMSGKFDNKIKGSLWLDNISLRAERESVAQYVVFSVEHSNG
jgi:hypothetical protein